MQSRCAASARRLAGYVVTSGMVCAALIVPSGSGPVTLLYPSYALKTAVVCGCAVLTLCLAGFAAATRRALDRRARLAVVLALVIAAGYAVAAARAPLPPHDAEVALRLLLPAMFAAMVATQLVDAATAQRALVLTAMPVAALVVFESWHGGLAGLPHQAQPAATLIHRNNAAMHVALALPLVVDRLITARRWRLGNAALLAALMAALLCCRSRTALVAAAVGMALVALARFSELRALARTFVAMRARIVAVACSLVVGVALALLARPAAGLERIGDRFASTFDLRDGAMLERYQIYADAFALVHRRPLTGWSPAAFVEARHLLPSSAPIADHPHNDLLGTAFEAGVPAAVALALLLSTLLLLPRRLLGQPRGETAALWAAVGTFCVLGSSNAPLLLAPSALCFWVLAAATLTTAGREGAACT